MKRIKSLLKRVKEESKKAGLKFNIQKTNIVAPGPITSRQIEGEKVEAVTDFIFLGSKSTVDPNCSHEIKRCLLLAREAMTNSDITLLTKVCIVKAVVFPVVKNGCESWIIKKSEHRRIDPPQFSGAGEDS